MSENGFEKTDDFNVGFEVEEDAEFDPPLIQTRDGEAFFLTCQFCGARSTRIPLDSDGLYVCGVCGEWGFSFKLAAGEEDPNLENFESSDDLTWEDYTPGPLD